MTRNIDIGAVISKTFRTYGQYAGVLIGVAAVVFLINGVFQLAGRDSWVLAVIGSILAIVLQGLYTGMVVELVNDTRDGRLDASIGGLINKVTPVLLTIIVASFLSGLGIAIGFVLCIIPGVVLATMWSVIAPSIVVERRGVFDAFSRSWELVKPNFWQTLGVILIFFVGVMVVVGAIATATAAASVAVAAVVVWVVSLLLAPLTALAASILFFELRAAQAASPAPAGGPEAVAPAGDQPPPPPPPPAA